ncbi:MAG: nitrogen fixation protein NifH [Sphaerochaeta sp.]|uniref:nitrogen fixation protein NifH n=1 Tax=Sphaerochaeta sp. TaxID=1972642 RepID=UPI003D0D7DB0
MDEWSMHLRADLLPWLLEESNPSVRYYTLTDLLGLPEDDVQVAASHKQIMESGYVPALLEVMQREAYRNRYPYFYTDKYKGLVWSLLTLAEHGCELTAQVKAQCEYMFEHAQEPIDGGFSMHASARQGGGRMTEVIPCLTGNMAWALIKFGYQEDARLQKALDWLVRFSRFNDGEEQEGVPSPYDRYEMCWGKHTCLMATVKMLKAFAEIPAGMRSPEIQATMDRGIAFLLAHHIYKRSHARMKVSKPGWLHFGYPLMYQTDILEILDILTTLGIKDARMDEAIEVVVSKQDEEGRWRLENTYGSERLLIPIGEKGQQSKWLTLRALRVLKRYGASEGSNRVPDTALKYLR